MIGFGIDLAGYTTGKTSVAAIKIKDRVAEATLLRNSHFSRRHSANARADDVIRGDVECLRLCLNLGPVAVDIPMDLQGLPNPSKLTAIWSLTCRPIDKKLRAMPPFADRIGAPVARFAAMTRTGNFDPVLGISLFETYPAETWRRLEIDAGNYRQNNAARITLCKQLQLEPHTAIKSDDDIDAIICAVTAVMPPENICTESDLGLDLGGLPRGYRIIKKRPFDCIRVEAADFYEWMTQRESEKMNQPKI